MDARTEQEQSLALTPSAKTTFVIQMPYKDLESAVGYGDETVLVLTDREDVMPQEILEAFLGGRNMVVCWMGDHNDANLAVALAKGQNPDEFAVRVKVSKGHCPHQKYSVMEYGAA